MLGHVQAIDAGLLGGLGEGEALVEQGGEDASRARRDRKVRFSSSPRGRGEAVSESPVRESAPCRRGNRNRSLRRPGRYGRRTWRRSRAGSVGRALSRPHGGG